MVIQAIVLALLVAGLYWARSRFNSWVANEPTLAEASTVFNSPAAAALVLSLMLSFWLYPQAPRLFWSIAAGIVIIPATLLIRPLIDRTLAPILFALVAFFFVDQFRALILGFSPWPRLAFLSEMLAAAVFFLWFITRRNAATGSPRPRWTAADICCAAAMAFFLLAFCLNAIGFGRLGILLGNALLRSAYLALILYTVRAVADALVIILLHVRLLARLAVVRNHAALLRSRARLMFNWAGVLLWI